LYLLAKRVEVRPALAYPLDMARADRIGHLSVTGRAPNPATTNTTTNNNK
jgi:hypothetical protein